MFFRALSVFTVVLLCTACAPDSLPVFGEQVWSGEHVEAWATDEATICAGSFEALDHHAELLTQELEALGAEARDERYRYYWLGEDEYWDSAPCRAPFRGCTTFEERRPFIYGFGFSAHELVHAELATDHHAFFDEGIAMMFGDAALGHVSPGDEVPVPQIIDQAADSGLASEHYGVARLFVGAVAALYPETFLPALLTTRYGDDTERVERRLNEAEVDFSAALQLHNSQSVCFSHASRVALLECAVEPTPWDGDTWGASGSVDCGSSDTIGPSMGGDVRWTVRSVDIREAGRYTASFEAGDTLMATMVYCEADWCGSGFRQGGNHQLFFPGTGALLDLHVGRYWFRIEQDMDDPNPGAFELTLEPGW